MAIKTVLENFKKAREAFATNSKTIGVELTKTLAELIPTGHLLVWRQYTPYFCDGDPCVFHLQGAYVVPGKTFEDGNRSDDNDGDLEYGAGAEAHPELAKAWKEIDKSNSDELFLEAFGDHARIVLKPDGTFKRFEYEHD